MRVAVILLLFLFQFSNAQLNDDFEDGTFLVAPAWTGDVSKFQVNNGTLQSNSTESSDEFYLSTKSNVALDAEWKISVNMRFSTSSANYCDIFLLADNEDLTEVSNGYYVRVGNTKDEVSLYKIENDAVTQLTNGSDNQTHNKNISLKVVRSANGSWEVYADYNGGQNYLLEGNSTDNTITTSTHFGILIKQSTASFHLKHFFDDIFVGRDTVAPILNSYDVLDEHTIRLNFDEVLDTSETKFSLNQGYGEPNTLSLNSSNVELIYTSPLQTGTYSLTITGLKDLYGNTRDTTAELIIFLPKTPQTGDLLFTEIFPDPTPQIGLPEAEFIEIYNSDSVNALNLKDCYLSDGGTPAIFDDQSLAPYEYVIITKTSNTELFESYGRVIGLNNFPTLNNGGDDLKLFNPTDELIDELIYTDDFYQDEQREEGGYTLERVFFKTDCEPIKNWRASLATAGGTPGVENSVSLKPIDTAAPQVTDLEVVYPDKLVVQFTERLSPSEFDLGNFSLESDVGEPIEISSNNEGNRLSLTFQNEIKRNQTYQLIIDRLSDCLGNSAKNNVVQIITTESPKQGDLIFNEILFNPLDDGVDYIELYNKSEKFINLRELYLARFTSERESLNNIIDSMMIIYPKTYAVLSTDTASTKFQYDNAQHMIEVDRLPPMNNDEGTILLLDSAFTSLDSLNYDEDMHFQLLSDVNGVSLERINFSGSSWDKTLWHSASSSEDFGTPGSQNSQFSENEPSKSAFSLAANTLSPDGDGYQDFLQVDYNTDNGTVLNAYVFNLSGKLISHIVNQKTLSTTGTVTWNGFLENGTKIPIGNYVLLLEGYNLDGAISKAKFAFSVLGNF